MDLTATQMDPLSGFWADLIWTHIITTLVALPPCTEGQQPAPVAGAGPAQRVTSTTQNISVCPLPPWNIIHTQSFCCIPSLVFMLDVLLFLFLHSWFCCTCTMTIKGFSTLFCSVTLNSTHHLILLRILGHTDGGAEARGAKILHFQKSNMNFLNELVKFHYSLTSLQYSSECFLLLVTSSALENVRDRVLM